MASSFWCPKLGQSLDELDHCSWQEPGDCKHVGEKLHTVSPVDMDDAVLLLATLWLPSADVYCMASACKQLETIFSSHSAQSKWRQLLSMESSRTIGQLGMESFWLHAMMEQRSMAAFLAEIRRFEIIGELNFETSAEASTLLRCLSTSTAGADCIISWAFPGGSLAHGHARSLPAHFCNSNVRFSVRLAASMTSERLLELRWEVQFCGLLVEEADYISVQLTSSIFTPQGQLQLPTATFAANGRCTEDLPLRQNGLDHEEGWLHRRLLSGGALASVCRVVLLVSGEEKLVDTSPSRKRAATA